MEEGEERGRGREGGIDTKQQSDAGSLAQKYWRIYNSLDIDLTNCVEKKSSATEKV